MIPLSFIIAICSGHVLLMVGGTAALVAVMVASESGLVLSAGQSIYIAALFLAFPVAGLIAANLLDRFCNPKLSIEPLVKVAPLLALAAFFYGGYAFQFIGQALQVSSNPSSAPLALLVSLFTGTLFCGALTAFCLIVAVLFFELTVQWTLHSLGVQRAAPISLDGVRTMLILTILFWGVHLIVDLFSAELAPLVLAGN